MEARFCTQCGHQLGIGRYCTNCGARITVPSNSGPSPVGPDLAPAPSARYPLFADAEQPPVAAPPPVHPHVVPPAPDPAYDADPAPRRRSAVPWLVALLVVAVVATVGAALLVLVPSGDDEAADRTDRDRGQQAPQQAEPDETDEAGEPDEGDDDEEPDAPGSVLAPADIVVPATAPPSVDGQGRRVTFTAGNMVDADPSTSWRMAGDGGGAVVTLVFDAPVTVTEVGLVNGYAKKDPPHDWYAGNRRITEVVWVFDDGTEVEQDLDEERTLQTTPVDAVETTTVELRIVEVTAPGSGPDARDYTAISDVRITGQE